MTLIKDGKTTTAGKNALVNIRLAMYPVVKQLVDAGYDRRHITILINQYARIATLDATHPNGFKL